MKFRVDEMPYYSDDCPFVEKYYKFDIDCDVVKCKLDNKKCLY